MATSEAQKKAVAKYKNGNVKQIMLGFYPQDRELYEAVIRAAEEAGEKPPAWIRNQLRKILNLA